MRCDAGAFLQCKPFSISEQLSTDEVYMMAGQNIVRRHVANTTSAPSIPTIKGGGAGRDKSKPTTVRSWKVSEASLQMLEQVQHLLSCVRSCEMALACANWVVRELPMGRLTLALFTPERPISPARPPIFRSLKHPLYIMLPVTHICFHFYWISAMFDHL